MTPTEKQINAVAEALWNAEPHQLLMAAGHETRFSHMTTAVKNNYIRLAHVAISAMDEAIEAEEAEELKAFEDLLESGLSPNGGADDRSET